MIEFASKITQAWSFLCVKILDKNSVSLIDIGLLKFSILSCVSLGKLCLLRNIVKFLTKFLNYSFYSFHICRLTTGILSLKVPDIRNLCSLSFSLDRSETFNFSITFLANRPHFKQYATPFCWPCSPNHPFPVHHTHARTPLLAGERRSWWLSSPATSSSCRQSALLPLFWRSRTLAPSVSSITQS